MAVVGGFVALWCYQEFNQIRTLSFVPTPGVISSNYLKRPLPGRQGSSDFDAIISFRYSVAGEHYGGSRVRYLSLTTEGWAEETVRRFVSGKPATVYFNQNNPSEAVLVRGLQGIDVMVWFLIAPFVLLTLVCWFLIVAGFLPTFRKPGGCAGLQILGGQKIAFTKPDVWKAIGFAALGLSVTGWISAFVVSLLPDGDITLFPSAVALVAAFTVAVIAGRTSLHVSHLGPAALAWGVNGDYRVIETADRIRFIMPRRSIPLLHMIGGYLISLPFLLMGAYLLVCMFKPEWIGQPPTPPRYQKPLLDTIVVAVVVCGSLFAIGCAVALGTTGSRFGRDEIHLSKAGLSIRRTLGPIRFGATRPWNALTELKILRSSPKQAPRAGDPALDSASDHDPHSLWVYSSNAEPLILAGRFPKPILRRLGKEVARAAARFRSGRKIVDNSAATTGKEVTAVAQSPAGPTAPKFSRLVATELPSGGVRITQRRNWPVAIGCITALALISVTFLIDGKGPTAWLNSIISLPTGRSGFSYIALAMMSTPFVLFLIRSLTQRIFEANRTELSRTVAGPFGRHSRRWARDQIAELQITSRTISQGKGGSRTIHSLQLRRTTSRPIDLVKNLREIELNWMRAILVAAMEFQEVEPPAKGGIRP
jgi:hypothetical protein